MQLGEILNQTWKLLGEPSDLRPDDVVGRAYLIQGINQAQNVIAAFKDPVRDRFFYYNRFRKEGYLTYTVTTGTISAGSTVQTLILSTVPETDLLGSVLTINGVNRVVTTNTGGTVVVDTPFDSVTIGDAYALRPRWLTIPGTVSFLEVLKLEDFSNKIELRRLVDSDVSLTSVDQVTNPTGWYRIGNRIYLSSVPESGLTYRYWYYKLPTPFTTTMADTAVSELPESSHFGIVLWAVYWGYNWMQEPTDAYAAQERFKNFMRSVQNELDVKDYMNQDYNLSVRIQ